MAHASPHARFQDHLDQTRTRLPVDNRREPNRGQATRTDISIQPARSRPAKQSNDTKPSSEVRLPHETNRADRSERPIHERDNIHSRSRDGADTAPSIKHTSSTKPVSVDESHKTQAQSPEDASKLEQAHPLQNEGLGQELNPQTVITSDALLNDMISSSEASFTAENLIQTALDQSPPAVGSGIGLAQIPIPTESADAALNTRVGSQNISGQISPDGLTLTSKHVLALVQTAPSSDTIAQDTDANGQAEMLSALGGQKTVAEQKAAAMNAHTQTDGLEKALSALNKAISGESTILASQAQSPQPSDMALKLTSDQAAFNRVTGAQPEQQATESSSTLNQVPLEIGLKVLSGSKRFDIRLDPPELGRIEVRLDLSKNGEVNAELTVDRVETLSLLQRDARTLERAFEQIGLKAGEGSINLTLRDPNADSQRDSSRQEQERSTHPHRVNEQSLEQESLNQPMKRYVWRSANGVDMHV
jgi:hypothetical protein